MRILIADDHELVRETLRAFLEREEDMDISTCEDLDSACKMIESDGPFDLVLLDYSMPGMKGLLGLETALAANRNQPIAIISGTAPRAIAQEALNKGAIGFLPKTMGIKSLTNAVRFMAAGEVYAPIKFMTEIQEEEQIEWAKGLSPRELQVLKNLCLGMANKEIAREIGLQEVTIKLHIKNLCRKLSVKNRTQAVIAAKDAGLF